MAKILIVEDDEFLRKALSDFLTSRKHQILEAPNGKVAREVIAVSEIDLILSDVQMPYLDGVELLRWVKENKPYPFILMTGFTNLLETQKAHDIGAEGFLSKPFKNLELTKLIDEILKKPEEQKVFPIQENQDRDFCKVSIEEFVARPQIDFDVFIRLAPNKFLKIAYQGQVLQIDRIKAYQSKNVNYLHIRREDFGKLVNFNMEILNSLQGTQISPEKKMNFMKYTGETLLEKCFVAGVDEETYSEAKEYFNATLSVISNSNESVDLLNILSSHSELIYAHSVGVAIYAVMIARKMDYTSSQTFYKLAMAGLFHDIGKKEIENELFQKPRHLLTIQERKLIESHVIRGKEILEALKNVPEDVIQMVHEHHEDCIGQGYPRGLTAKDLHPLSKILYIANAFVKRALTAPGVARPSLREIVETMEKHDLESFDIKAFNALKMIVQAQKSNEKTG